MKIEKYNLEMTMDRESTRKSGVSGCSPKAMGTVEGQKVMIKGFDSSPDECLAELFAYNLGTALGIGVNKVKLIDCGDLLGLDEICSVHWWENSFITHGDTKKKWNEVPEFATTVRRFFDKIMENSDRHSYNWGWLNNELFLIDNGFCSPWEDEIVDSQYIRDAIKLAETEPRIKLIINKFMSLTENDFKKMLELPSDFKHEFDPMLIGRILERMAKIQEFIEGREKFKEAC